jgi:membrane protease YdiL (CAAX protease family)
VTMPIVILFCIINPFFEEAMELGYFVHRLKGYGMWSAILASACFRGGIHAFFGLTGMALLFGVGLVFGLVYWRWRTLWPVLLAHSLTDFFLLLRLVAP